MGSEEGRMKNEERRVPEPAEAIGAGGKKEERIVKNEE